LEFYGVTLAAVSLCLLAMAAAVFIPRGIRAGALKKQIKRGGGHVFTPDPVTWQMYLASTGALGPLLTALVYAGLLTALLLTAAGPYALGFTVALGVYLLLRHLLYTLPPTYGVTAQGVTVLSWLPNFPLGPRGSGSVFIPWTAVEVCVIDNLFFTVLTPRQEAKVVFPPEMAEQVCRFVDSLLRRRGYEAKMAS